MADDTDGIDDMAEDSDHTDGDMDDTDDCILRFPEILRKTGLSKSQIYRLIARGSFPAQVRLSARAVGWRKKDIDKWLDGLSDEAGQSP